MAHPETGAVKKWLAFGPLGTILGPGTLPLLYPNGIQCSSNHMVAHPGKVLDTSTADQNDGVFLQIVADSRNVGGYLNPVRKSDPSHFAKS